MATNLGTSLAMGEFAKGAGYAVAKGSNLVYDTIMTNAAEFMTPGVEDVIARGSFNDIGTSGYGAYGIGTTAEAAGGTFFGSASSVAIGETGLYFNPYALAAAIAIQLIMEAMSCTQDEKDLQRARGQNLCHYIGDYCSSQMKVLGVVVGCVENTQAYCCYNGLLAKAVEEGAHTQLGLSWGTPSAPNCQGLTPEQLTSLDFNSPAMLTAMEPFKQQIMQSYSTNMGGAMTNGTVLNAITDSAKSTSQSLCAQRQKLDPTTVCN